MLVATDIAARGIDVTALGHVVNFDVPPVPEDYIHRVGRTARAELTGSAFTLVSPEEENDLRGIEHAIGKRLPRVTVPDFDYTARHEARLEIPLAERIAEIRARKDRGTSARQGQSRPPPVGGGRPIGAAARAGLWRWGAGRPCPGPPATTVGQPPRGDALRKS